MNTIEAIKPGPKPKKPDGEPDRRRRVTPPASKAKTSRARKRGLDLDKM